MAHGYQGEERLRKFRLQACVSVYVQLRSENIMDTNLWILDIKFFLSTYNDEIYRILSWRHPCRNDDNLCFIFVLIASYIELSQQNETF